MELVIKLYKVAFVRAFDTYGTFFDKSCHMHFRGMGYGDESADVIIDALRYANSHCVPGCRLGFDVADNKFSDDAKARLRDALPVTANFYAMVK